MKRVIAIIAAVSVLVGVLLTSAYAIDTEPSDSVSDPSEPGAMSCLESPSLNVTEPSDPVYSITPDTMMALNGATVNVSQESIQAIADAVKSSGYTYQFANKNDRVFTFSFMNDEVHNLYLENSYLVIIESAANGRRYCYFSDERMKLKNYNGSAALTSSTNRCYTTYFSNVDSGNVAGLTEEIQPGFGSSPEVLATRIVYANYDVLSTEGTLLYSSDVPVGYTISFETGFDDLVISSQNSLNYSIPTPEKPGYIFLGWYTDPDYSEVFSGGDIISDITLYAKWTEAPPMAFFSGAVLDSFSVLLECEPILYLMSLCALAVVLGFIKWIVSARC